MATEATRPSGLARGLTLLIEVPAVAVTFLMMVHVTLNAVMRTWFESPIKNTLETVEYWYLPLVAFLGFIAAQLRGQHIAADLVYEMLPHRVKRFVLAFVLAVCAVVVAAAAWFGWGEAVHAFEIRKTAGVSDLPAWPPYFLVPLAFGSLTVQFLIASVRAVTHPEVDSFVGDVGDAAVLEAMEADLATTTTVPDAPQENQR